MKLCGSRTWKSDESVKSRVSVSTIDFELSASPETGAQAILKSARVPLGTVIDVIAPPGVDAAVGSGAAEPAGCCAMAGNAATSATPTTERATVESFICSRLPS